jgi:prepilin-type N-terminal cleavage/methylation domain-containing protein
MKIFSANPSNVTKRGFSLIEVMMATLIVGILATGVISGVTLARRLTYVNAQRVAAFGLAKARIEELKGVGYEDLDAGNPETLDLVNLGGVNQQIVPARLRTNIRELENPDRKRIVVRVDWRFEGKRVQERVRTFLYPRR